MVLNSVEFQANARFYWLGTFMKNEQMETLELKGLLFQLIQPFFFKWNMNTWFFKIFLTNIIKKCLIILITINFSKIHRNASVAIASHEKASAVWHPSTALMLFPNQGRQGSFLFADLNKNSAVLICLLFLLSPKAGIQLDMIAAILNQAAMTALILVGLLTSMLYLSILQIFKTM